MIPRTLVELAETALHKLGLAFNVLILAIFVCATAKFYNLGMAKLQIAGGLADWATVRATVQRPSIALGFVVQPGLADRALSYAGAWLCLIAAAGFGWMAILGLRWLFLALSRGLGALK